MNALSSVDTTQKPAAASQSAARVVELLGLFVALPLLVRFRLIPAPRLAVLLVVTAGCAVALRGDPTFSRARHFSLRRIRGALGGIAARAAAVAASVALLARLLDAPPVLSGGSRAAWIAGLALYPFLSALPQEVVYRVFFFHRYSALFPRRWSLLAANGLLFGWLHLVYPNLVAPLLSVPAGVALAITYERKGGFWPALVEHTLYGLAIFALGLGAYFFDGRP